MQDLKLTEDEAKRWQESMKSLWDSYCYTAPEDTAKIKGLFYRAFDLGAAMVLEHLRLAEIADQERAQAEAQAGAKT